MPYELYAISGAPRPWRVLLGLVAKNLDFELKTLEASKQEQKAQAFLALNPRGRTPVLKNDDFVLCESLAILAYLDRQHPNPPLFGATTEEHARIWEQVMAADHYLREACGALVGPLFRGEADDTSEALRKSAATVRDELRRLEQRLAASRFLCGEQMSAADCVCFPEVRLVLRAIERAPEITRRLELAPFDEAHPRLARWVARIEALPGYPRTFPAHWRRPSAA